MKIDNAVALVTGANRGIGLAFTRALLARGARKVYAGARDPSTVTEPGVLPLRLDVTKPEEVATAVARAADVTLVINNAGVGQFGGFLAADSEESARRLLETNFFGMLRMSHAFAPVLAANGGGAFVNVLSVGSWIGSPILSTYSASKSAAWNFTNSARVELKRQGTHVVGVHVGFVDTDLTAALDVDKIAPAAVAAAALDAVQAGEPEAVVDDLSRQVKAGLSDDQRTLYPQVELDFAALVGSPT
jgi:NAD(P)-dependent dehydrogenase (short-subunit alcohol dehydrogenase family)